MRPNGFSRRDVLKGTAALAAGTKAYEQAIRERAYQLWIESGCQDGEADAHWLAAQREVISVSLGELGRVARLGIRLLEDIFVDEALLRHGREKAENVAHHLLARKTK